MASSTAYDIASSDDEVGQLARSTSCNKIFKHHRGFPVKRKVIDPTGRLGSLYDNSTHRLIDRYSVPPSDTKSPSNRYICHVFSGESSSVNDVLEFIGFSESMRRNIQGQIIKSSGIASIAQNKQPINQNTRFLYYAYKHRQEKILVNARKAHKIVPQPNGRTEANYMITKIIWGFEFLYIIQIPQKHPVEPVDTLLQFIQNRLKKNEIPIRFDEEARPLFNRLNNTISYGSETCIDNAHVPLLDVLNQIEDWQQNTDLHQPLVYVIQPLRWLFNNSQFPESCSEVKESDSHIVQANKKLKRIENQLKELDEILYTFPANFPSAILNQRLKEFRRNYEILLDRQEELQRDVRESMQDILRHRRKSTVLDTIMTDLRYESLSEEKIKEFRVDVEQLADKAKLIEQLNQDRIEYINAFDVGSHERNVLTNQAIDAHLKRIYSKGHGRIVLWYSGDRLRREKADKWRQIYQQLTSERQQATQRMKLIYVDFTQCQERLENFIIVRLPDTQRSDFIQERLSARAKSAPSSPVNARRPQRVLERPRPIPLQPPPPAPRKENVEPLPPPPPPPPPPKKRPTEPPPPPPPPPPPKKRPAEPLPPPLPPAKRLTEPQPSPRVKPTPRTEINVLLLGETGVGKSTFINAFVNYLKFETLEQAERGEPVVLIPVSFLITLGDNFDEFIVKYGDVDANEDHEHQGQSVTQHCKSYIFDLNDQVSLRLIDTPGIGDTRGIAQDVKNIDHILTYINTLPYLNAVCLLLKPNASRLTVFFRSCINQLLTYLTPIGYENIIFCFTNSRSTFYTPGDTGRLLREMLVQEHLAEIPFKKQNTFCFDSESFRYLAARRRRVDFDDYQKVECRNSWKTSVDESVRLLDFIETRPAYRLQEYQSPRKVVIDITMYARALMETLRLIIYNWKITEAKLHFNQMILTSKSVGVEICTHCAQANLQEIGPFWITQYQPPAIKTANEHRQCPLVKNHFLVEAVVEHQFALEGAGLPVERWQSSFHDFLLKCDRIHHFLRQQGPSAQDDPFGSIIERFLEDEQQISQIRNIDTRMNRQVQEILQSIRRIRQRNSQQLFVENERLSVRNVYRILEDLMAIPTVQKLIESIQRSREAILKTSEQRISANIIRNRTFL